MSAKLPSLEASGKMLRTSHVAMVRKLGLRVISVYGPLWSDRCLPATLRWPISLHSFKSVGGCSWASFTAKACSVAFAKMLTPTTVNLQLRFYSTGSIPAVRQAWKHTSGPVSPGEGQAGGIRSRTLFVTTARTRFCKSMLTRFI